MASSFSRRAGEKELKIGGVARDFLSPAADDFMGSSFVGLWASLELGNTDVWMGGNVENKKG